MTLRPAENFLAWALAISIAAHLAVYGGYQLGQRLGLWQKGLLSSWLKPTTQTLADIQKSAANSKMSSPPHPGGDQAGVCGCGPFPKS